MPAIYFLNSVDLASATYIYSDASMTTEAAEGYYSDGTICRHWYFDLGLGYWILEPFTYCA
jgi:hypothetical protein